MKRLSALLKNGALLLSAATLLLVPAIAHYADAATGTNLIGNPLVETVNPANPNQPEGWTTGGWGTNQTTYNYLDTGSTGDTDSVNATVSDYTSGAAEWYFAPVAVTPGMTYTYSDSYTATADSEIDALYTLSDGTQSYAYLGTANPSSSWTTYSTSFTAPSDAVSVTILHMIYSNGSLTTDNFSLTEDGQGPSVTLTSPTKNENISGNQTIAATVADGSPISNVTFEVDGQTIGTPVTTSPYQLNWDSTTVDNGTHTITAIATDTNGQASSTSVNVDVSNASTASGNVMPNPGLTTVNPSNSSEPANWQAITWGTNTTKFSYLKSGYNDSRSVKAQITSFSSGASEWMSETVPAAGDTQYRFSDYYKSNINSEIEIEFNMSDGSQLYEQLGLPQKSLSWRQYSTVFNAPVGAVSFSVYQFIDQVGYVTTDGYSIAPYTPVGFNRPLVSLTFDDGWLSTYTNGIPLLQKYGFTSTQFIITDEVGQSGYVTQADIKSMANGGNEIASHTITHDDMTQEPAAQLQKELSQSQKLLENWTGKSVTDMAYPFGLYNANVEAQTAKYYSAARGIEVGLNSKDVFNPENLKVEDVFDNTTTAQVADWVKQAQATNTWLILVYHSVSPTPTDSYNVTPTQLDSQLAAIQSSGVTVENMNTALKEVESQLQ